MCPFCQTVTHKNVTHKELGVYDVCTHRVNISKPPALLMESLFELCGRATKKKKALQSSPSLSLFLPLSLSPSVMACVCLHLAVWIFNAFSSLYISVCSPSLSIPPRLRALFLFAFFGFLPGRSCFPLLSEADLKIKHDTDAKCCGR